ncbi:thiamine phosphate synthase [candidate division WOR-3 bacterium]|nr:thiamine phosphate synthase [candidate division WOR-3 bacterium]
MKFSDSILYLVTDRALSRGRSVEFVVEQAVKGGVGVVQLREKNLSTKDFLEQALKLKDILSRYDTPLIINDRLDIVLASGADGIHIGQSDMPYEYARKILGHDKIIGLSVENFKQAEKANEIDVDYIGISPVFVTSTKPELASGLGIEGVREIVSVSKHHKIAIGGLNSSNALDVLKAGSDSLAVVSAIVSADDPMKAARELKDIILEYKKNS